MYSVGRSCEGSFMSASHATAFAPSPRFPTHPHRASGIALMIFGGLLVIGGIAAGYLCTPARIAVPAGLGLAITGLVLILGGLFLLRARKA